MDLSTFVIKSKKIKNKGTKASYEKLETEQ